METFKDRLTKEHSDLRDKLEKLENFVGAPEKIISVNLIQQNLLRVQVEAMRTYLTCLDLRIDDIN